MEGEKPKYFIHLWKIYAAAHIVDGKIPNELPLTAGGSHVSNSTISDSNSIFSRSFKSIHLDPKFDPEEIKDEEFFLNVAELESFIKFSLNKMEEQSAVVVLSTLLRTFNLLHGADVDSSSDSDDFNSNSDESTRSDSDESSSTQQDLKNLREGAMNEMIINPLITFFNKLLVVHGKYKFNTNMPKKIKPKKPSQVWESHKAHNDGEYPKQLINRIMFHNCKLDIAITLKSGHKKTSVCAIEMKGKDVSGVLEKLKDTKKFSKLAKAFRQSAQYQIFLKVNTYMISNFSKTIYFEYPLKGSKWISRNQKKVYFTGKSLRYRVFDNSGSTPPHSIQLQLLLMLKAYDAFKRNSITDDWLKDSNGQYLLDEQSYRSMDEGWKPDLFSPFIVSLFKRGFKKKLESSGREGQVVGKKKQRSLNSFKKKSSKRVGKGIAPYRSKDDEKSAGTTTISGTRQKTEKKSIPSSILFPEKPDFHVLNYTLLSSFSNSRSTKIISFLNTNHLSRGNKTFSNERVFFKIFDVVNLQSLHSYITAAGMPRYQKEVQKFTESEINIMASLEGHSKDFKHILESLKKTYVREITALRKISQWNSTHSIKEQINSPKLLQYGWTYLELPFEGKYGYAYWGPFICTEYLEFINDNEYKDNPKRIKNLNRQIEILLNAGIDHNDFKKDNFCFDKFDQAFFVDFDQCVIDDNRYLKNFDFQRIYPNEKCS
ncbi:hypothetical protein BN7_828 [Wickerhamomyces ciferrii]|uniref:Protein kinase domain-containing protein n=1 Tax=Wickerhamomyces ciferrii (strain ATCC 14091 / BCRC 22168 / CBS 111 / JCM 3599 / NBRC 0793 / NRRL Y-1031 F-60-10) TaxID=1206466 RepID=K0KEG7_WICCF|nr:uncharacterized protein BN7_828 [Wickerhamomyces ciferrii]CCH41291.1 hypothetical protein BN7_828 [Wickerhamomyces ciferrii]